MLFKENKDIQLFFRVIIWKRSKFVYFVLKGRNGINEREFMEIDFGLIEGKFL